MDNFRVFIDLDGVVVDLDRGIVELGVKRLGVKLRKNRKYGQYGSYFLQDGKPVSSDTVWQWVSQQYDCFWARLPETNSGITVVKTAINLVGLENVFILSAPFLFNGSGDLRLPTLTAAVSSSGKIDWCHEHLLDLGITVDHVILTGRKYLLANAHSLLIDDTPAQTNQFSRCGGHVLRFTNRLANDEKLASLAVKRAIAAA